MIVPDQLTSDDFADPLTCDLAPQVGLIYHLSKVQNLAAVASEIIISEETVRSHYCGSGDVV